MCIVTLRRARDGCNEVGADGALLRGLRIRARGVNGHAGLLRQLIGTRLSGLFGSDPSNIIC